MADPWAGFNPAVQAASADPWSGFQPVPQSEALSWSDVPGKALQNAPESAGNFVGNIAHAVMHPVQTVSNLADLGAGALRHGAQRVLPASVTGFIDSLSSPESIQRIDTTEKAVLGHLVERYGTEEGIKKALATDPVGAMADLSAVLTGGGSMMARAPGIAGRAGQAVQAAGRAVDPIVNAGRALQGAGRFGAEALGVATSAGARPMHEAAKAGFEGNQKFIEHLRDPDRLAEVVDMADNGVRGMVRDRSAAYTADMNAAKGSASWNAIDMTPAFDAYSKAISSNAFNGIVKDREAGAALAQIGERLQEFRGLGAAARTVEGMDALKQTIGAIRDTTQQGTNARRVVDQVYHAVKDAIVQQAPEYAKAMKGYADASDQIGEMRRTLSVNDKATTDTTLRKLQSTMRNNVNTNYGQRTKLLDELAKQEPDLPAALAGQVLNALAPRGLARLGMHNAMTMGAAYMNPLALATLPFQSPRLVGEALYAGGRAAGIAGNAMSRVGVTPELAQNALLSAYAANVLGGQR